MKKKSSEEIKRVPRYSLILETFDDNKYYYDFDLGTFVKIDDKSKPTKATIEKIDFLTANYDSEKQFMECFNINNPKRLIITYQFNGEKKLAPVFSNPEWAELAKTFRGQEVDFRNYNNLYILETIYNEIMNLTSDGTSLFGDYLRIKCNLSPKTEEVIKVMVAHERATINRYRYLMGIKDYQTESYIGQIYSIDRDAFKSDFKKRMTKYRELRTVYLNYCKLYKNKVVGDPCNNIVRNNNSEKKLVKEPAFKQISMFDKE